VKLEQPEPSAQRRGERLFGNDVLARPQRRGDGIGHHWDREDQKHEVDRLIGEHGAHGSVPHQRSTDERLDASHALFCSRADGDQRAAAGGLEAEERGDVGPLRKPRAANEADAEGLSRFAGAIARRHSQ
jgi:hypothetical protein